MSARGTLLRRRDLLRGAAVAFVAPFAGGAVVGCADETGAERFVHGVASGDPLPDGVVLWTRVSGDGGPVDVTWEVFEDPEMARRVMSGSLRTDGDRDFTVKVDVRGLASGRTYYYRFRALDRDSPVGRTRTAPAGPVDRLRLGVASCASLAEGYFHGYRELAAADLDAIVHLGDYIYEEGAGPSDVRAHEPPHEILTLEDYRTRHAQYKRDPDLQEAHRQHVFVAVWDDHEVANNGYRDGAEAHTADEGNWSDRKAAAQRAYNEWMPIREQPDGRIFRRIAFGDLVDLLLLDTRFWGRTQQKDSLIGPPPPPDPSRTLLGEDQAKWMEESLASSTARWKMIGQQVMLANLVFGASGNIVNFDQWHGYPESRARLIEFLRAARIENVVVLTGDIHSSWANEIALNPRDPAEYDPATGRLAVAVEIVTPGITSPGIPDLLRGAFDDARPFNPHVRWADLSRRGFVVLDVTPERAQATWHHYEEVAMPEPRASASAGAWSVRSGSPRLESDPVPALPRAGVPARAPGS